MRLFVAVELPPQVRADLRARAEALRDRLPGWRWTPEEQWHVTLAFLGEVPDERLSELTRRLAMAAHRHVPFALELTGLGAFSSARHARVLWAGVGGDRDALKALAASVGAAARRAKVAQEERRYRPHVTLARRRDPADVRTGLDALGSSDASQPYAGPAWTVEEVVLVRSHLGPRVRHEPRERFALRAP